MWSWVLLIGCAEYSVDGAKNLAAEASYDATSTMDSAASQEMPIPAYFALRGSLQVGETGPEAGGELGIEVVGDDLETVLCEVPLSLRGMVGSGSDDVEMGGWWTLEVQASETPCAVLPETLGLGVGVLTADVKARLGAVGREGQESSLFGAYVQVDSGDIFSFGYAGTGENLDQNAPATLPLLPGAYLLAPLYLLALPPQSD